MLHLRSLRAEAREGSRNASDRRVSLRDGLRDAIAERNRRTDASSWGGLIGLTWMVAYWATLIPLWVHAIARVIQPT